jgi:hypothetical protein
MPEHLTDEEIRRMAQFEQTPAYERDPEQLLPDGEESE